MIELYTERQKGHRWLERYQGKRPIFACILGFTATGLIPGISAAGATSADREYTAVADAEFLINGVRSKPKYPLPPLDAGASPVLISRAVIETLNIPVYLFDAGLPHPNSVRAIDLGGSPANCVTSSKALPLATVKHLFTQGLKWGEKLAKVAKPGYLIIGECVVGGTTTALGILTGLGFDATGKVNSSHRSCNHVQKWNVVEAGLKGAGLFPVPDRVEPFALLSAVGDPMQAVAVGMAIGASRTTGVMLGGGTQMLAVYALIQAIVGQFEPGNLENITVGTTNWVALDSTGDTVGLAELIGGVPLLATGLSFAPSIYPFLRVYEQGYVKEGVGAGACAIAAHLYQGWSEEQLLAAIERLAALYHSVK